MKIKSLILENFRGYQSNTTVQFNDFTAFIGKNDAGKSTILDAIDIFFENSKPDSGDASVNGDSRQVKIGLVFKDHPAEITLDAGATTSFEDEYLLNNENDLEIHKVYNLDVKNPGQPEIYAIAVHPKDDSVADLLQKTNPQLKGLVNNLNLENECNLSENPSMRRVLYSHCQNVKAEETRVPLNKNDGKQIWQAVRALLPVFVLFKSDRSSSDQDPEAQDPMKVAVVKALLELENELQQITEDVRTRVEDTANRTLSELKSNYPNIANALTPKFRPPAWQNVFKIDLESDEGVPLNKRGSGVRRLILMSFLQAEAKRKSNTSNNEIAVPVIYAIEEPETSQHPNSQRSIVSALKLLADSGDQVIITTHVPGLAGLVPTESLRYVNRANQRSTPSVQYGSTEVFRSIAETLGVHPDIIENQNVKVAVLVEGPTDIEALLSIIGVFLKSGELENFDESKIFWVMGGGTTLKHWVCRDYIRRLNLPRVIMFDSDSDSRDSPDSKKVESLTKELGAFQNDQNLKWFKTRKREIENYIDLDELNKLADDKLHFPENFDPDFSDMEELIYDVLNDAISNRDLKFNAVDSDNQEIKFRKNNIKKILSTYVMRQMSAGALKKRSAYLEGNNTHYEVLDWLTAIGSFLR